MLARASVDGTRCEFMGAAVRYRRPSSAQLIMFDDLPPPLLRADRVRVNDDLEAELVELRDGIERAMRRLRDTIEEAIEDLRADLADDPDRGEIDVAIEALDESLTEAVASAEMAVS